MMKMLKFKLLEAFAKKHPDAKDALMRWAEYDKIKDVKNI